MRLRRTALPYSAGARRICIINGQTASWRESALDLPVQENREETLSGQNPGALKCQPVPELPPRIAARKVAGVAMTGSRENKPHVLLISGAPGSGKTTVICRAATGSEARGCAEEIREKGERRGFRLVSFDGTADTIPHIDLPKNHRVGQVRR